MLRIVSCGLATDVDGRAYAGGGGVGPGAVFAGRCISAETEDFFLPIVLAVFTERRQTRRSERRRYDWFRCRMNGSHGENVLR